jgi:hypothetical protein
VIHPVWYTVAPKDQCASVEHNSANTQPHVSASNKAVIRQHLGITKMKLATVILFNLRSHTPQFAAITDETHWGYQISGLVFATGTSRVHSKSTVHRRRRRLTVHVPIKVRQTRALNQRAFRDAERRCYRASNGPSAAQYLLDFPPNSRVSPPV